TGALAALGLVALGLAVLLEVGLVPAAAGEAERRRGQLAPHPALGAAGRARGRVRVGELLQAVELMAAGGAAERVDGHGVTGWEVDRAPTWGRGGRNQAAASVGAAPRRGRLGHGRRQVELHLEQAAAGPREFVQEAPAGLHFHGP